MSATIEKMEQPKYTEAQMIQALLYQKGMDYQICADILLSPGKNKGIRAVDYLANDKIVSIEDIDEMIKDM